MLVLFLPILYAEKCNRVNHNLSPQGMLDCGSMAYLTLFDQIVSLLVVGFQQAGVTPTR